MKLIRRNTFETNSSSTHSISICEPTPYGEYLPASKKLIIDFVDTNDYFQFGTLREKVSYLVSHIIRQYMYDEPDYESLIEDVKSDYDFRTIERFVKEKYNTEIIFPTTYDGDLEYIVEINHQLINTDFDDLLRDIMCQEYDMLLSNILSPETKIIIGRD